MSRSIVASLALAALLLASGLAGADSASPRVSQYFHRGDTMDTTAPADDRDASVGFGLLPPHAINFTSQPLAQPVQVAGGAYVVGTFAARLSVRAVLTATYTSAGVQRSSDVDVSISTIGTTVIFPFVDLDARLAKGETFKVQILIRDLLDPVLGQALDPTTVNVTMLYDSTTHPGGINFGNSAAGPAPVPPSGGTDGLAFLLLVATGTVVTVAVAGVLLNRRL